MPTTEFSSPTATSAVNEKRRPPLTTLATRLISITRSCRSRPCGLTVLYSRSRPIRRAFQGREQSSSELQAALAGALGERGDAAVEAVTAAVEDAARDARRLRPLGEELADALGLVGARELSQVVLGPRDGGDRAAGVVIDQLRADAAVRAEDRHARALRGASDLGAHATPAAKPLLALGGDAHARLPTFLRTCSPA